MDSNELRNPFAELVKPDSGILVTAQDAGYSQNYFCPHSTCRDPERKLFRKQSKNGRYFFCHYGDYEHLIGFETLLHKSSIAYFKESQVIELPILNGKIISINPKP